MSVFNFFQTLPTLVIICLLNYSHPGRNIAGSHVILLCIFFNQLIMLSISSYAYWPLVCSLNIYSAPLPIFNCVVFLLWTVKILCSRSKSFMVMFDKKFSSTLWIIFTYWWCPLKTFETKVFNFDEVQFAIFPLRLMLLLPYTGNNFYTEIMQIWAYFLKESYTSSAYI